MATNKYAEIVAPATYAALTAPDVEAPFTPDYWVLTYVSGADAYYSFDGINNHGRVRATFTAALILRCKASKIWLKQVGGASTIGVAAATL